METLKRMQTPHSNPWASGAAGAAIGGTLGSPFGVVGIGAGAAIGGTIGAIAGVFHPINQ